MDQEGSVLVAPTGDYDADEYQKADGVRVAIQKGVHRESQILIS